MTLGIGNTPRIAPGTPVGNPERTPAQPSNPTARPCGHSTQDTFTPGTGPNEPAASAQPQKKKKKGMFKELLEKLLPMLQQLIGGLGQKQPQQ